MQNLLLPAIDYFHGLSQLTVIFYALLLHKSFYMYLHSPAECINILKSDLWGICHVLFVD